MLFVKLFFFNNTFFLPSVSPLTDSPSPRTLWNSWATNGVQAKDVHLLHGPRGPNSQTERNPFRLVFRDVINLNSTYLIAVSTIFKKFSSFSDLK